LGLNLDTLDAIKVFPLKVIAVEGGDVMHGIKKSDSDFEDFGEAYFSWINYCHIKGWKKHLSMAMNLIVPIGEVKFVFYCDKSKQFRVEKIGNDRYCRIHVPPGIWFGFMGCNNPKSLILNIASCLHDPKEALRLQIDKINFKWEDK
jgi:dTDP-4-dehydrorhamnose 3,5-epimerase